MSFFTRKYRAADLFTSAEVTFLINLANGGGGTVTILAATGAVNGINTVFGMAQQPNYVISDGVWYANTDSNGVTQWTWNAGTLQVTMVQPPTTSIIGIIT